MVNCEQLWMASHSLAFVFPAFHLKLGLAFDYSKGISLYRIVQRRSLFYARSEVFQTIQVTLLILFAFVEFHIAEIMHVYEHVR